MGSVALEGFGGGGVGLNFKIIGNPMPETAKENTIWIDTDTEISSWAFASSEHDAMRSGRNFLSYPYLSSTTTVDGIHFEDNKDGSVTVNGTKNNDGNNPQYPLNSGVYLPAGNYYVSGCPKNVPAMVLVWDADNNFALAYDAGNGARFDLGSPRHVNVVIEVTGNQTISNAVFNPRITSLNGLVWITTDVSSLVAFNATKKNTIMVYPLFAKQYVNGAWVDKTAKSYQGGAWVEWWNGQLYDAGNEYEQFTGGITSWSAVSSVSTKGNITKNSTNIVLSAPSGCSIAAGPSNKINLTKFSKFCINVTSACSDTRASIRIFSDKSAGSYGASLDISANKTGKFELDISNVNGEFYPAAMVYSQSGTMTIGFDKLWLE